MEVGVKGASFYFYFGLSLTFSHMIQQNISFKCNMMIMHISQRG